MQARNAYPVDTCTGGCFVTKRYEIAPGEKVCDLDTDLDTLPAWGRLVVSELGVRMMARCLDINIPDNDILATNDKLTAHNRDLVQENRKLRKVITAVLEAAYVAGYDVVVPKELEAV